MHYIPRLFPRFFDMLFPQACINCHATGTVLCTTCLALIRQIVPPVCRMCGLSVRSPSQIYCSQCFLHTRPLHGIRSTGYYQEPLRTYIHMLKYRAHPRLAGPLGQLLAQTYLNHHLHADLITSVPLYTLKQEQRGYNQAQLLARECARSLHIPLNNQILIRHTDTATQTHLTLQERYQNVAHAFHCAKIFSSGALLGKKILVIDDVCTTGSTLAACAAPLFAAGAREVWGLVLARPDETKQKDIVLKHSNRDRQ